MVPDGMAFVVNTLCQAGELVSLNADKKKCCGCLLTLEDVKNLRCPLRIGAIIEGERDLVGTVAITRHAVRFRQRLKILVGDLLRVGIDRQLASAVSGPVFDAQDLALALHVHKLSGRYVTQLGGRGGVPRNVPYLPYGSIFAAQPPQSECLDA